MKAVKTPLITSKRSSLILELLPTKKAAQLMLRGLILKFLEPKSYFEPRLHQPRRLGFGAASSTTGSAAGSAAGAGVGAGSGFSIGASAALAASASAAF